MGYWIKDKDSKNVIVKFDKKGGMEYRSGFDGSKIKFAVRMVQPLRPNIKK